MNGSSILGILAERLRADPFNGIATSIFVCAILHTFAAARVASLSHRVQRARDARADAEGRRRTPSVTAEVLHFFGEVEVVFGLWAVVLFAAMVGYHGWEWVRGRSPRAAGVRLRARGERAPDRCRRG